MSPRLLALDSSTECLSLAACDGAAERQWQGQAGALSSSTLLPQVRLLLQDLDLRLDSLDAIAWGQGPGAFTGLRSACAVAQGLAWGSGIPVLPVDSLMLVAEAARERLGTGSVAIDIAVALDARMGEVYAGRYRFDAHGWHTLAEPGLWGPADLAQAWRATPTPWCTGSGLALWPGPLPGEPVATEDAQRPGALLRLARAAWAAGRAIPADEALPLYVRDRVALTTAERAVAAHGATAGRTGAAP